MWTSSSSSLSCSIHPFKNIHSLASIVTLLRVHAITSLTSHRVSSLLLILCLSERMMLLMPDGTGFSLRKGFRSILSHSLAWCSTSCLGKAKTTRCVPIMLQLFFANVQFFSLKKLKMHKTGIEWEKVDEDPFNRSATRGISFDFFFAVIFSRNAFELQSSWSTSLLDRACIQETGIAQGKISFNPTLCQIETNSIKHLIYHLHGIKMLKRQKILHKRCK